MAEIGQQQLEEIKGDTLFNSGSNQSPEDCKRRVRNAASQSLAMVF